MKARYISIVLVLLLIGSFSLSAQVAEMEESLNKKELRAKRKEAREIQKLNKIEEVRKKAKVLLEERDFVVKDDGRSGAPGAISFFKIHGDTISIQTWSQESVGTVVNYREGSNRMVGDILNYEIQDNGADQPLQAFIWYVDRFTFERNMVSVYVFGKRVEAGGIRGDFSRVVEANIWESGMMTSGRRRATNVPQWLGGGF